MSESKNGIRILKRIIAESPYFVAIFILAIYILLCKTWHLIFVLNEHGQYSAIDHELLKTNSYNNERQGIWSHCNLQHMANKKRKRVIITFYLKINIWIYKINIVERTEFLTWPLELDNCYHGFRMVSRGKVQVTVLNFKIKAKHLHVILFIIQRKINWFLPSGWIKRQAFNRSVKVSCIPEVNLSLPCLKKHQQVQSKQRLLIQFTEKESNFLTLFWRNCFLKNSPQTQNFCGKIFWVKACAVLYYLFQIKKGKLKYINCTKWHSTSRLQVKSEQQLFLDSAQEAVILVLMKALN